MGKIVIYTESAQLPPGVSPNEVSEIIVSSREISPSFKISWEQMENLIGELQQKFPQIPLLLQWDTLPLNSQLAKQFELIKGLDFSKIKAVRVQDLGALSLSYSWDKIQEIHFLAESGHRNLQSLLSYVETFSSKLKRISLSPEVPSANLKQWCDKLKIEKEILVFGKILLFHSPRPLLEIQAKKKLPELLSGPSVSTSLIWEALGESEESPHRGFYFFQGAHGLLMYLPKELSLLPSLAEIQEMGIEYLRLDWRFENRLSYASSILTLAKKFDSEQYLTFKAQYPAPLISGFYMANHTDRQFKNLKNSFLGQHHLSAWAEVRDVCKGEYTVLQAKRALSLPQGTIQVMYLHPEGKTGAWSIESLQTLDGREVRDVYPGMLLRSPYKKPLVNRTQIYFESEH